MVEGFVQILLIDRAEQSAYANVSFPDLVEITGYLILYRYSFFFYRKYLKDEGLSFPKLNQIYELLYSRKFTLNLARSCFQSKRIKERRSSVSQLDGHSWTFSLH